MKNRKQESIINVQEVESSPEDCNRGHACSFCPKEPDCNLDKPAHNQKLVENRLHGIGMVFLVMANKGGVGKSTVAANLAVSLSNLGYQVGLGDADVHGPSAPRIFGLEDARVKVKADGIDTPIYDAPRASQGLKVGSLGFFLSEADIPVVWRDAYKHDYIHHMIGSFNWGPLDFLVIDMPPGTGNELITLTDLLEGSNLRSIMVSSADAIALQDTLKATRFCKERGVPILGLVENYAGMVCPACGTDIEMFPRSIEIDRFKDESIPTLARLPFARDIALGAESGNPAAVDTDSPIGKIFIKLAESCKDCAIEENRGLLETELSMLLGSDEEQDDLSGSIHSDVQKILEIEKQRLKSRNLGSQINE